MRKIYLSLLAVCLLNLIFNLASAQSIPPTNGGGLLCANCVPTGWTKEDGWPAQSSHLHFGSSNDWVPATPFPPSGQGVGGSIFMGLQTRLPNHDATVSTSITGLVPGKGYKFTYYVISAKTQDSDYGEDIRVNLEQDAGPQTFISQLTEFSAASNNLDKWIKRELVFTAGGTTASLTVIGATKSDFYKFETVAIDIDVDAVQPCDAGTAQVTLSKQVASTTCPSNKFDLTSLVVGQLPPNIEVMWFTNPNHSWIKYLTPKTAAPDTYYAFYYDKVNNCYNTDNSIATVTVTGKICEPCSAGGLPVTLSTNKIKNICPATLVDLKPLVTNVAPPGSVIVFYSTPNHAPGTMIPEIQMTGKIYVYTSGTYYAFFYDQINECFNTDNSIAAVEVTITECPLPCKAGTKQVILSGDKASTKCPTNKIDLNTLITSITPDGAAPVWFKNPNHSGPPYATPQEAEAGTYYAFYYDAVNDCYNTNDSQAKVVVTNVLCPPCNATTNQVVLNATSIKNICPSKVVNLKPLYANAVPDGATLVFYTTPDHQPGTMVPEVVINGQGKINVSVSGVYYAFFFDQVNSCFNTDYSSGEVTVTIDNCLPVCNAGTDQVGLISVTTLSNTCPATTVALGNTLTGVNYPPLAQVMWFDNPNHSGNPYPTPQTAGPGDYYAFFYDMPNDCYNTDNSTAKVTVTINPCAEKVQLNVKVNLQGAMHANLPQMRNELQTYDGVGLLPQLDPYGDLGFVPEINNPAAVGSVVDWIRVEVRSAANPANILESQSLILRPNGDITNADLTVPKFTPQAEPVRIVIKHRNHVAIMSNSISTFGVGPVSYDFTTALAQAYNDGSASDQMKLVNGVWCMINGDPNQNLAVENQDINQTRNSFNQGILDVYSTRDLNMNGVLENLDMNIQRNRFNGNCFSILINY